MLTCEHYIDGESVPPASGEYLDSFDPFLGEPWARVAKGNAADVERAVQAAHRAFTSGAWPQMTASERGRLLCKVGELIARDARELAELEVRDNGKLLFEMQTQLNYAPQYYYYFGGLADKIEGAVIPVDKKGYFNFTRHEPLGVVAAITPWNSPLLLLTFKIAPALAAGCTVVVKPSEFASVSTLRMARLFKEAGFPPGVINVVTGYGADVGPTLVEHPLVKKITFTGSDETGKRINTQAAKHLKHVSLELGGKSPNIIFEDANFDNAVSGVVGGIFAATGQTCVAGSRLLLQESIHDRFVERLLDITRKVRMGNPMQAETQIGPVATRPQYDKVLSYIDIAKKDGAKLLIGGKPATRPECGNGWFVEPTLFDNVHNDMRIAQEEVFGPVLSILTFKDEAEALAIANDVRFGLGAGVWTNDIARCLRMSAGLQAGTVWVNTYRQLSYTTPFGGYKDSGIGRENGVDAVREYLQTKSVWINVGAAMPNHYLPKE